MLLITGSSPASSNAVMCHLRFSEYLFSKSDQMHYYAHCESIYNSSPYLKNWERQERYNNLTKHGFVVMIQRVFTIAGLQGPLAGITNFLKNVKNFSIPVDDRFVLTCRLVSFACGNIAAYLGTR
jgi:hypothetical protein